MSLQHMTIFREMLVSVPVTDEIKKFWLMSQKKLSWKLILVS